MLTVDNAAQYLLTQRLLTTRDIIHGDLDIISATRRNRNLQVTTRDARNYLIKQPDDPSFASADTLRREAAFYALCASEPRLAAVRALMPRLVDAADAQAMIILELLQDALPVWRYYESCAAEQFPTRTAAGIGKALGTLHRTFDAADWLEHPSLSFLPRKTPWILTVHRPNPEILAHISSANYQIIQILQQNQELTRQLDQVRKLWQLATVIHGDVKMDNLLAMPVRGNHAAVREDVYLVDWELVQLGDPAWDLAGALQDFVFFWVLSMPHDTSPEEMVEQARFPLPVLQPAIRSLWQAYRATRELSAGEAGDLLHRAVRFSAARIIQTAYEMAGRFQVMPTPSVLLLQVGVNLLTDPEGGQVQLYGLI